MLKSHRPITELCHMSLCGVYFPKVLRKLFLEGKKKKDAGYVVPEQPFRHLFSRIITQILCLHMFTKCFQNALEPKHPLGTSIVLKYVGKGSAIPGNKLDHQAITTSLAGLNIYSTYAFTGEHFKNFEVNLEGPDQLDPCFNVSGLYVTCISTLLNLYTYSLKFLSTVKRKGCGNPFLLFVSFE